MLRRLKESVLDDDDGGIEEALRRDAQLDNDASCGMTLEEFKSAFRHDRRHPTFGTGRL
jgi:hypothetical protein